MNQPTRPALRYFGGKWRLAPWVIGFFPKHRVYVEPFGGGASVLLRKPRSYAEVYNDMDAEIVNFFRVLRDHGAELREQLRLTPFARDEYDVAFTETEDAIEHARRTVVRSFMGFGSNSLNRGIHSGFRANSNRSGTTPAHDWRNYPEAMHALAERMRGVVIENTDAIACMRAHDSPETLHYVDPPYVHATLSTKACGAHGYVHTMTDARHEELANALRGLSGHVILSGYNCQLYADLFSAWKRIDRQALADGAGKRIESLWLNPRASALGQQRMFE